MKEPDPTAPAAGRPNIRLSLAWFGAAVLLFMVDWSSRFKPPSPPTRGDFDTYYVVVHYSWTIPLSAVFALFGALYLGMTPRFPIRLRPALGWAQLAVMSVGTALIDAPHLVLSWVGIPTGSDLIRAFEIWNRTSSLGYLLVLGSLLIFLWALVDGLRRRPSGNP